tara:strand:+ start:656 stop:1438 length:783 start_codon:yes stop_codon:yes gene_type:complete
MNIKIDVREKDIIKLIKPLQIDLGLKFNIEILTLPLGDIIIEHEKDELLIIERKKLTDLAASIKDGRYVEQSYRLSGCEHPNHHIIFLVEGEMEKYKQKYTRIPKKTLYSAMFCLNYYEGFSLMRTANTIETVEYILRMADKMNREKSKYGYCHKKYEKKEQVYSDVVKKVKKLNITPKNIGEIMLCQIPGISVQTAKAIMAQQKTISDLIKNLRENKSCLREITYKTKTNKVRHISKTSIKNLIQYLLKEEVLNINVDI